MSSLIQNIPLSNFLLHGAVVILTIFAAVLAGVILYRRTGKERSVWLLFMWALIFVAVSEVIEVFIPILASHAGLHNHLVEMPLAVGLACVLVGVCYALQPNSAMSTNNSINTS